MYGRIVVCFITFICLQLSSSADVLNETHNINCDPWPTVVQVSDEGKPYFVKLYRCQGSADSYSPRTKRCIAKTANNVTIKLTTSNGFEEKQLENHTSCDQQCAPCSSKLSKQDKDHCGCTCDHKRPPPGEECEKNYAWDSDNCLCKCNLREGAGGTRKRLDKENCKFVCIIRKCLGDTEQSPDNCRCRPKISVGRQQAGDSDNTHQGKVLAALVIGEFVFLYLIFDFLLYSKKTGLMYYVRDKCRSKPAGDPAQNQPEATRCLHNEDQENNVRLNVMVDKNGQSHVPTGSRQHVSST